MANPLKIGVVGASGRMGRMVISIIAAASDCELAGASEAPGSAHVGADAGVLAGVGDNGVIVTGDTAAMFGGVEAVIDFTVPVATMAHAQLAADANELGRLLTSGIGWLRQTQMTQHSLDRQNLGYVRLALRVRDSGFSAATPPSRPVTVDPSWGTSP